MEIVSDQGQSESQEAAATKARPLANFQGSGGVNVAVWKHKSDSGFDNYSIRIERNYKDDNGNFKSTQYLRDQDLPRVEKLLAQADDWIEMDKAKGRATRSGGEQAR